MNMFNWDRDVARIHELYSNLLGSKREGLDRTEAYYHASILAVKWPDTGSLYKDRHQHVRFAIDSVYR